MQQLSWAVDPEDPVLAAVVGKFLDYARRTGLLDRIWTGYYGISLIEYIDLIQD
jgi:membrane-bound lytic murein transglycosylase MltF